MGVVKEAKQDYDMYNQANTHLKVHHRLAELQMPDGGLYEVLLTGKVIDNATNSLYMVEVHSVLKKKSAVVDAETDALRAGVPGRPADTIIRTHEDDIVNAKVQNGTENVRDEEQAQGGTTMSLSDELVAIEQEKAEIKARAIAEGTFMLAPNGKPTKLTEDQWLMVRTKAFKNYFGDWERKAELTLTTEPMPNADADAYLREHASGKIKNLATGIEAEVNSGQRDKMLSKNAKEASAAGGFSYAQHNYAASRVATLFRHAILMGEYEDKNHTIPAIMRFACPLMLDGKICFALMTVKKSQARKPKGVRVLPGQPKPQPVHGHTIYSIQLDKIEEFGNQLGRLGKPQASRSPNSKGILDEFNDAVKTYFEDVSKA